MPVNADFDAILKQLQTCLDSQAPAVAASLRPGLAPEALAAEAARLDFVLPPELAALYAWHDGQPYETGLFDYFRFYPLADAISEYLGLRAVSRQLEAEHGFVSWPPGRLPLFGFEGEYFAVDCLPGAPAPIWFVFIEDEPRYWFASLAELLRYLSDAYEAGAYRQAADGQLTADERALHALRQARISPPADPGPLHALL